MSVINKMLRDLDLRAQIQGATAGERAAPVAVTRGTASVTSLPVNRARRGRHIGLAGPVAVLLAGLVAGGIGWFSSIERAWPAPEPEAPKALAPAKTDLNPTVAAQALPAEGQARAAAVAPIAANAAPDGAPMVVPPPIAPVAVERVVTAIADASNRSAAVATNTRAAASVAPSPAPVLPPSPSLPTQQPTAPPVLWQDAAMETVGQAQRRWATGSRDAALDLLRETLAVLERSHGAELASAGSAVTLALLRELARMELAQGQPAAVLALLQRYEPQLTGRADLWAMRGNAAQRIGQHGEASQAYQTALKIRPGEPRWMLGAAVSLAAQGQVAAAAELAEQARGVEAVSPEVLAYLRQLGVPLRDR